MQSYMQLSKPPSMQSYMHSSRRNKIDCDSGEDEIHSEMQVIKSEGNHRAYKAKPKEDGISQASPEDRRKILGKGVREIICLRAPTPTDIDLPSSREVESDKVLLQDFSCNKIISFLPTYEILPDFSQRKYLESSSDLGVQNNVVQKDSMQSQQLLDMQEGLQKAMTNSNIIRKRKKAPISYRKDKKNNESIISRTRKISQNNNDEEDGKGHHHLRRPQHKVLGFMEDHAEFTSDWEEASKYQGRYVSSVLESTVDGSIIKGARRVTGSRRMTPAEFTSCIESAIETGDVDEDPLKALDEWGLKTELHKYKCSLCEMVSDHRIDVEQHIDELKGACHSDAVVEVLLGSKAQGRNCTLCNVRLGRTEYFTHIREEHKEVFPLHCGYCAFQGQDYNQLRHHIQKKHKTSDFDIIDMTLSQEASDYLEQKDSVNKCEMVNEEEAEEEGTAELPFTCPLCEKSLKTLRNLKKHVMQHSRQKKQCILCPFTTNFPTQIRSHYLRMHPNETPKWKKVVVAEGGSDALVEDASPFLKMVSVKYGVRKPKEKNWVRQYRCPHCSYTCNFNSSYNRHLRVHNGVKPFKCGYCSFHGREAYVVKRHCIKAHKGKDILVENGQDFKAPYRYAKRIKKEAVEWDESCQVVEKGANNLASQSSNDLSLNIKVEVQSEELSKSNTLKESSDSQIQFKDGDKKYSENKAAENSDGSDLYQTKDSTVYQCLVLSSGKNKDDCTEKPVINQNDSASCFSVYSRDDCKKNIEKPLDDECQIPLENSKKDTINISPLLGPVVKGSSFIHTQECATSKVEKCFPELENVRNLPEGYSSAQHQMIHTIKVKTFRGNTESSIAPLKEKEDIFEEGNPSHMQIHCDNDRTLSTIDFSSSYVIDPSADSFPNSVFEAVVINLYANESYTPRELITHNSTERLEDGCVFNEKICTISDHEDSPLNLIVSDFEVQLSDRRKTFCNPEESSKPNPVQLVKSSEKCVKVSGESLDGISFTIEKSSDLPPEGLENTLHNHITFLSDSLNQRVSNRISAPPGVMTRDLLCLDYSNSDYFSSEKVRTMMIKKKGGLVMCAECGVTTKYRAFYKHAKKHFNIKPFRCGYCLYRSIEKSKIRVHNAFCHPSKPCVILKLSPDSAKVSDATHHSLSSNTSDVSASKHILEGENSLSENGEIYPSLLKSTKTSEHDNRNKDIKRESKKNSTSSGRSSHKIKLFQCPICCKVMKNHTPSIRRHLCSHYSYKPYKCGYCAFTAIGQTEIRAHHVTHGSLNPPKIESSDAPMPLALTQYLKDLLGQHRGNKRVNKKKEMSGIPHLDIDKNPTDIMWHEPEALREDLATINLNIDPSQADLVTDNHHDLESLGVETCSLQTLESVEFSAADPPYTVQVLESDRQSSNDFSSDLPSHLDLNVGAESGANGRVDPVCEVYLIPT
ncbi:uncharacterized protein LOC135205794 [Macrobrachium nipponense]|uniref:uncharacterized protein LOC135205794 n=1 Tax=Macrobrachium nipponense TaxID=159736 RepID=UPI0030C7E27C